MPITLAQAQSAVLSRCQDQVTTLLWARAGFPSAVPTADPNAVLAYLGWPIDEALAACGASAASPGQPADADFLGLPDANLREFYARAMLETTRRVAAGLGTLCDMARGIDSQKLSQLAAAARADLAEQQARVDLLYPAAGRVGVAMGSRMFPVIDPGSPAAYSPYCQPPNPYAPPFPPPAPPWGDCGYPGGPW